MPASFIQRFRKNPSHFLLVWITAPVIYGLIIPTLLVDISMTVFQEVCFRVYGIPRVRRRDYIVMDRGRLAYLNPYQKLNCLYCEYANGVVAYASEIAARTEWYWCPIKHSRQIPAPHAHYDKFMDYGDSENFRPRWRELRKQCRACEAPCKDAAPAPVEKRKTA